MRRALLAVGAAALLAPAAVLADVQQVLLPGPTPFPTASPPLAEEGADGKRSSPSTRKGAAICTLPGCCETRPLIPTYTGRRRRCVSASSRVRSSSVATLVASAAPWKATSAAVVALVTRSS